jgi:sialate O-acetylesterase
MKKLTFFLLAICLTCFGLQAGITLPKVLSSNMILQRDMPVPIWGTAQPGEPVTITFGGQVKNSFAAGDGRWLVNLDPMSSSFEPRTMRISASGRDTVLENILVGDVWLCGGQSNMEYPMRISLKRYAEPVRGENLAEMECRSGGNSNIRLLLIDKVRSLPDCTTKGWQDCTDSTLSFFSACGYFFGKNLQETLKVPIGLIASNWGGTRIEPWTPGSAYEKSPIFAAETAVKPFKIDNSEAGSLYNSMIAPLAPLALKGFIWYQGESNAMFEDARYVEKTKLMLDAWRSAFKNPTAPFYYVQIAPYYYTKRKDKIKHTPQLLAEFCEQQTNCQSIPNTGQVVVTDLVDNLADIHPSYKWEIGRRLSLLALNKTYGKADLVCSGPQFKSMEAKGKTLVLTFDNIGSGLTAGQHSAQTNAFESLPATDLTWFEVAAKGDTVFHAAKAIILKDKVIVSCPEVKKPAQLRFCWNETAMPNFFNKEGLPAVPFRVSK